MFTFTPLLLALLPMALSAPHPSKKEPTITSFAGAVACPSGLRPFHASTSMLLAGVSAERAWHELGDFCEVEWQGFEIIATKGACNSHRSLRSYHTADLELTERLDLVHLPALPESPSSTSIPAFFSRSPYTPTQVYAHGYTMLNRPKLAGADVVRMKSMLKVVGGKAGAKVSWDVVGCSDYPEHLADKLEEVHEGALWSAEGRIRENGIDSVYEGAQITQADESDLLQVMEQVLDFASMAS